MPEPPYSIDTESIAHQGKYAGAANRRGRRFHMARKRIPKKAKTGLGAAQTRLLDGMHQIWLAGLGAVSKAQKGTPKLLDELIVEGARVHAKARVSTKKALRGAVHEVQAAFNERIGGARERAGDVYENLEKVFQTRVHRALHQLGVPSSDEVAALSKRVDALNANIAKLGRRRRVLPRARARARVRVAPKTIAAPAGVQ
jgi:poly(hydroxyalkanoate) granule-associated protein